MTLSHENAGGNTGERFPTIHLPKIKGSKPGLEQTGLFFRFAGTIPRMTNATIRFQTRVLAGHRIEVSSPQLSEGTSVEVLVSPSKEPGHSGVRQEVLRLPIEQRRQLLMRQADTLAAHYALDTDRSDWQGGDIVE